MWVEVELELELDENGEDGWRVWGLQDISFGLLQLQSKLEENLSERNQLLREQNSFLQRITMCLERARGVEAMEPDLDSTMRNLFDIKKCDLQKNKTSIENEVHWIQRLERGPELAGYAEWKSTTSLKACLSLEARIQEVSLSVPSYPVQWTRYSNLQAQ